MKARARVFSPWRYVLLLPLLLSLSGCVWLRLLEFKNQLAEFDHYFRVERGEHFIVHFHHPVLYRADFEVLAKLEPTRTESLPQGMRSWQIYRKQKPADPLHPPPDIVFQLDFNAEDKLVRWDFSPSFMAMAPAPYFEASLRALGKGKVDRDKHRIQIEDQDFSKVKEPPPRREDLLHRFGEPDERKMEEGLELHIYHYRMDSPKVRSGYENRQETFISLYYDPVSGDLARMRGKFCGLKFSIDYKKLAGATQIPMEVAP